jgi:hypothetical protein
MSECCDICADTFSIQSRKKISCPFDCGLNVCASCIKRQFNESEVDIQCMGCKKPYTQEHLSNIFSKYYLKKDYKTRRGEILFNREKAQIPDTMAFVEQLKEADILADQANKIRKENERLRRMLEENTQNIYDITTRMYQLREGKVPENKEKSFYVPCAVDGCRGFVNKSYICTVCDTKMCKDCHEILIVNHVCDENVVKSVKEIKNTCKNCPKCGTSIHKIEGCDQMWCTNCHTTFSWRTGYEVTGIIHNPHYYAYMREHGGLQRQPGDVPCGGLPAIYTLRRFPVIITEFVRFLNHVEAYEMHYYNTNYDNKIIRANYIRNQMSKDDFINALVTREREINKNRDIRNVYDMIRVAGTDIIQKYISENNSKELISQFIKLIDYTNNEFLKLSKIYTLTMPYITLDKNKYSQNTYMHISSTGKSSPVNYEEKFLDTLSVTQTT